MRTTTGQPIRLSDYRPPDYLIDDVRLDISLNRTATRVVATLSVRPNPAGRPNAPLYLDGDELRLASVALDGAPLEPRGWDHFTSGVRASRPHPPDVSSGGGAE